MLVDSLLSPKVRITLHQSSVIRTEYFSNYNCSPDVLKTDSRLDPVQLQVKVKQTERRKTNKAMQ